MKLESFQEDIVPLTHNFVCGIEELVTRAKRIAFDKDKDVIKVQGVSIEASKTFRIDEVYRQTVVRDCRGRQGNLLTIKL